MVNIGPQFGNLDPLNERRRLERNGKAGAANANTGAAAQTPSNSDQLVNSSEISSAEIQRYVDVLKNMDPSDLHRVEDLRQSIEDGSYDSNLNDLIDPLLDFLSDGNGPSNEPA